LTKQEKSDEVYSFVANGFFLKKNNVKWLARKNDWMIGSVSFDWMVGNVK
jgi:hypothetical protein